MNKMKLIYLLIAVLLMPAVSVFAGPEMTISESTFNFGYCPQLAEVSHKFTLISTGDEALHIMKVIPGCSCTKMPLEKERIEIGDSTRVEIIFSTKNYRNRVTKTPAIQTNQGPPDQKLQILATIVANPDSTTPLVIQPFILDLSQKTERVIDRMEFGIRNVSDEDVRIEFISGAEDYFSIELPKSIKPGEMAKGRIQLLKTALDKPFSKSFTIQCNDDNGTRYTIPVKRLFGGGYKPPTASNN